MLPAGSDGRKQCQSVAMYSPDGERVDFSGLVTTEGQPEEWLNNVERAMFDTTRINLHETLQASEGTGWVSMRLCSCLIWTAVRWGASRAHINMQHADLSSHTDAAVVEN